LIPPQKNNQLLLDFTSQTPPVALDEAGLQALLARLSGLVVRLTITDNRTRMASFARKEDGMHLRLHRQFLEADRAVIAAVANWMKKPKAGVPQEVKAFVSSIQTADKPVRRRTILYPFGQVHNLRTIYEQVNARFFGGKVSTKITFGKDTSRQRVRIRRLGSFSHSLNLITIHPLMDNPRVPEWVVAFTVYHEMLHALQPAGHKRPHDAVFRKAERIHPDYKRVMEWRKKNVGLVNGGRVTGGR
jgi:hypothetical protein